MEQGQIIKTENGGQRKILGICGKAILCSAENQFEKGGAVYTKEELQEMGYIFPKKEFIPQEGQEYWYLTSDGGIETSRWDNHSLDIRRKETFGVYETRIEAEEAVEKIKNFLKQ